VGQKGRRQTHPQNEQVLDGEEHTIPSSITGDIFLSRYISVKTDFPQNYSRLQLALSRIGYFRRGTLIRRLMTCGKAGCACKASPPRLHGPYYQWTRKLDGKTVTVNLSAQQAKLLEGWIATGKELDRIVAEMERMSLELTERMLHELPSPTRKAPVRRHHAEQGDASEKLPD